jgi:hypothetical protein
MQGTTRQKIATLLVVAVAACTSTPIPDSTPTPKEYEGRVIREIWERNVALVQQALDPVPGVPLNGFPDAIAFFEALTGIQSDTGTYLGTVPTEGLRDTLKQWQAWYSQNEDQLYWDDNAGQVRLKSTSDPPN